MLISQQNRSFIATDSLGGPRECIPDIIATVEDFCGISDVKTRASLFSMSFISKTLPIFFEILRSLQNCSYIATDSLGVT